MCMQHLLFRKNSKVTITDILLLEKDNHIVSIATKFRTKYINKSLEHFSFDILVSSCSHLLTNFMAKKQNKKSIPCCEIETTYNDIRCF